MSDSRDNVKARIETKLANGRITRGEAIRLYCIGCCSYQPSEVTKCVAKTCPLYRYRMGHELSEGEQLLA